MEAKEGHKVQTCNVPNAFIETKLENKDERIILTLSGMAADTSCETAPMHKQCTEKEKGQSVLHSECTNATHGTLKAALSFHTAFENDIEAAGFEMNPCDRCVANKEVKGKQMTIAWHVDDVKMSHDEDEVLDEFIECLRDIHDDEEIGTLKSQLWTKT